MNKKVKIASAILFFSLLPVAIFSACDKDTNCYLDVKVLDGSTDKPVSDAKVQIYQSACDSSDFNYREGVTDAAGGYSTSFKAPGIMHIKATVPLDTFYYDDDAYRISEATIRIVEGETKLSTIHLTTDTTWINEAPQS